MVMNHTNNPLDDLRQGRSMTESAERAMTPMAQPRTPTLQPLADGSIRLGRFRLTKTGLLAEGYVTETDWRGVYAQIAQIHDSLAWLIGDWANMGERTWGKTYAQIAELAGLKEETVEDYAYVARAVETSIRIDVLSFGHHRLVAALAPDEQRKALGWAAQNHLSVGKFDAWLTGTATKKTRLTSLQRFQNSLVSLYEKNREKEIGDRLMMARLLEEMALALRQENPVPAQIEAGSTEGDPS